MKKYNLKLMSDNLMRWADLTELYIELKRAFLKKQYKNRKQIDYFVFHEVIEEKERRWKI